MGIIFWIFVFIASLALLVKSADWVVENSEKIALALKISPFIVAVTIVAIGTSLPELAFAIAGALKGTPEIVVSNTLGTIIANILLIGGLSAIVARVLIVERSLIDLDIPLFAVSMILFVLTMMDKKVVFGEGILLLLAFLIYVLYTVYQRGETEERLSAEIGISSSRVGRRRKEVKIGNEPERLNLKVFLFLILGIIGLAVGADYLVESVVKISKLLKISTALITITATAVGTSLPELAVSVGAAAKKKYEIALGNVFGSNIFDALLVGGLPALISTLPVDSVSFYVGIPFLIATTFMLAISGISRKIYIWEGAMYVLLYVLFVAQLFNLF